MRNKIPSILLMAVVLASRDAGAGMFRAGRELADERDFSLRITAGQISDFQVMVQETSRRLYDVTGEPWKQDRANAFDLNDFNIRDSHSTIGISMEKGWKYFTLQFDASYVKISSTAEARRNYYLSVGRAINYQGAEYDHLKIEEGAPFSLDVNGGTLETRLLLTPFTFHPFNSLQLTPFLETGLFGFVGYYDLDAGETTGVTQYQNPPVNFAVGGHSRGGLGMGIPQYGGGAELRIGQPRGVNLVLQGHYTLCNFRGSSSWLTGSSHREKRADIDHRNTRVRLLLEIPVRYIQTLTVGVQYQQVESEGSITSRATDPEEIIALRERFDKNAEFRMKSVMAFTGISF